MNKREKGIFDKRISIEAEWERAKGVEPSKKTSNPIDTELQQAVKVAIVGSPNVGKSSLLNRLVNRKVSIVSPTPHTTRESILGIAIEGPTQIIFLDTPGYIRKDSSIWADHFIKSTSASLRQSDVILVLIDAMRPKRHGSKEILEKFAKLENCIIAINKIDTRARGKLYEIVQDIADMGHTGSIHPISVRRGDGISELKKAILSFAKKEPWISSEDAEMPKEIYAAECLREKIFYCMKDEVPFGVRTEAVEWSFGRPWLVKVNIFVEKDAHKRILIGHKGESLKRIGIAARTELEGLWGRGSLFTHVITEKAA